LASGERKNRSRREHLDDAFTDNVGFLNRELFENCEHQLLLAHGAGVFDPVLFGERDELGRRFRFKVLSFISRIGVVLWRVIEEGCEVALEKSGHEKGRSAGLSEESAGKASNLMRWPAQRGDRNTTTSACVGWDLANIENRSALRKQA
jgi:hypothetical protein